MGGCYPYFFREKCDSKKAYVFIAVATMLLSLCCGVKTVQATGPINSVTLIISDMQAPQDAYPHGVPKHYSWANGGIATGRFKYVTTDWQAFNMTTLPADQIRSVPPPLE